MANKEKKSSIIKDALALFAITLVAAIFLGIIHELTAPIIAERKAKEKAEAYQAVFKEAAKVDILDATLQEKVKTSKDLLESAGLTDITIDEAGIAVSEAGTPIGYVFTITTAKGYQNSITIAMGYSAKKEITGFEILTINETAGLGMNAREDWFKNQYVGKSAEWLEVTKSGNAAENQIDAISSATITSQAVTGAANAGIVFALDCLKQGIGGVTNE